ncbi:MAG: insulinase family protein [Bacteroidales bacterium]|nr:insulinase family protein [Bacteroidales bacterium]
MKRIFLTFGALVMTAIMALAQQPTREQMEAAIAQMPKIPNSEAYTIGHLDNGLTYYIRHNELPKGRAEFYLATNVGAIEEEYPAQDGLAHFLEHMCFNGTEHFPGKAILDYLRSIGAEFGRNINASTGFEETQYMLNNIPVERATVVDSCLMILADYSHYVLNEPKEIDAERGVIIEERRTRRNASWRAMEASLPYYFGPDTKQASCTLIGTQEHLETFKPESLVEFYHTWYHPGNQALIVVGDVDVARTEAKIKEIFGVIPAKENPVKKPIQEIADHAEPRVGVITDPETTSPTIEIIWHSAALPEAINATYTGQMTELLKGIINQVMYERFNDITSKPGSPYLSGSFGISSLIYEDIDAVLGEVALREDNILGGLKDFYTELVRLQRYGITDAEFDRAKTEIVSMYETRANRAETRQNAEFIRPIISNFFDKEPLVEPKDELEVLKMLIGQFNAAVVNQAAKQLWDGNNMVVIYSGPEKEGIATPTAEQLLQVIADVNASEVSAPAGEDIPEAFLDPAKLKGAAVAKTGTTIYGAQEWTLKNGVKVIVYPTDLQKDQILFNLHKDGGMSLVADADMASFDSDIFSLFQSNSGVSAFSGTTVSKMLTGKTLSVSPYFDPLENGITGSSTVKDFETALQLVYLYFTDPRFDPEEWQNGIDQLNAVLPNLVNQPNYKFQKELYKTMYNDSPRRQLLSEETVKNANLATVEKYWKQLFADAAGASFVIVGDVNPEAIKPLVEKYIGSLPKGKKPLAWVDTKEYLAKGKIEKVIEVDMQTPKSTVYQIYNADIPYTYKAAAALDAVSYILDMRYTNSLREEEGGTYGASTQGNIKRRPKENAMFLVGWDCKPALCDKLRQLAIEGFNDLAMNGPTDDEMNSAKLNLQKNIPESRQRNSWWRSSIELYQTYGEDRDALYEEAVNSLTKEDLTSVMQALLSQGNFMEIVMKPAKTAEAE